MIPGIAIFFHEPQKAFKKIIWPKKSGSSDQRHFFKVKRAVPVNKLFFKWFESHPRDLVIFFWATEAFLVFQNIISPKWLIPVTKTKLFKVKRAVPVTNPFFKRLESDPSDRNNFVWVTEGVPGYLIIIWPLWEVPVIKLFFKRLIRVPTGRNTFLRQNRYQCSKKLFDSKKMVPVTKQIFFKFKREDSSDYDKSLTIESTRSGVFWYSKHLFPVIKQLKGEVPEVGKYSSDMQSSTYSVHLRLEVYKMINQVKLLQLLLI